MCKEAALRVQAVSGGVRRRKPIIAIQSSSSKCFSRAGFGICLGHALERDVIGFA